jgi:hypothetical protein
VTDPIEPPQAPTPPAPPADPVAEAAARRRRNIFIALGLAAFMLLVYLVTILRMGGNILERPL